MEMGSCQGVLLGHQNVVLVLHDVFGFVSFSEKFGSHQAEDKTDIDVGSQAVAYRRLAP